MFTIPLSAPSVERFNKRKSGSDAGDPSKRKCPRVVSHSDAFYVVSITINLMLLGVLSLASAQRAFAIDHRGTYGRFSSFTIPGLHEAPGYGSPVILCIVGFPHPRRRWMASSRRRAVRSPSSLETHQHFLSSGSRVVCVVAMHE
jgi:hypothetical protein